MVFLVSNAPFITKCCYSQILPVVKSKRIDIIRNIRSKMVQLNYISYICFDFICLTRIEKTLHSNYIVFQMRIEQYNHEEAGFSTLLAQQ